MLPLNSKVIVFGSLLVVAGLLLGGCAAAKAAAQAPAAAEAPQPANAADSGPRLLNVTGTGTATAAPDVAYVELGVDVKSTSAAEAVSESTDRMTKVMEAIKALGVEEKDVQTITYNIWVEEEYDKEGNPTGQRTYHVVNEVRVTLRDLDQVGTLLEDALDAGANTVGGIRFSVEDPTALQAEARDNAIADARARAKQLAEGLGVTLGEPYTINEYGAPVPRTEMVKALEAPRAAASAPVPVSPGELTVSVQISVAWTIQ